MKRYWYIYLFLTATAVLFPARMSAQAYFCDFEDSTECTQWVRNYMKKPASLENKWYIGAPGQFSAEGSNGLYISSDADSARATYVATKQMFVLAYRDLTLAQGQYTVMYDYRIAGGTGARLSIWWLPRSLQISSSGKNMAPDWTGDGGVRLGFVKYNNPTWQSEACSLNITNLNTQGRLVVVWESQEGIPNPPSACIDNIVIFNGDLCTVSPRSVNFAKGQVTWQGNATQYVVTAYNTLTGDFLPTDTLNSNSWTPIIQDEGYYIIYVKALCNDGGYTPWATTTAFIYIPGKRCVEYMDIGASNTNTGVCYVGDFDTFIKHSQQGILGKVDDGSDAATSMHTLHTTQGEYDANTRHIDGGFKTIPDGEIASVRLGAYTGSGQSARIEYKYAVQQGMSDLLDLRYAVVMESGGHGSSLSDPDMQPTFRLDVLDGRGVPLASTCAHLDFMPGFGDTQSWHNDGTTYWCDWSTVTVSLRQYVGQTLTIRLTSTRCSYDTHYAYAYFTIGCRNGSLEGIACGDFSTDHFTAPEGFNYEWYKASDPSTIVGTERELHIDTKDTAIYVVDVISPVKAGCYYSLTANPNPRYAHAELQVEEITHTNCTNNVIFRNLANVSYINRETYAETISDEPLDAVYWDFGDGTGEIESRDATIFHAFPATGGSFRVRQVASMSNGICQDTVDFLLELPDVTHAQRVDTLVEACAEAGYELPNGGGRVYNDTTYHWLTTNKYGCFVDNQMKLHFFTSTEDTTRQTICEGEVYPFEGKEFSKAGTYTMRYVSVYGCDSLRVLDLSVTDRLDVEVPDTIFVCADNPYLDIPYEVLKGTMGNQALLSFDTLGIQAGFEAAYNCIPNEVLQIPMEDSLRAGYYPAEIVFDAECAPLNPSRIVVAVQYANTVMESMAGLLALYNSKYNGGYEWTEYQWYCNGQPIEGANMSYLMLTTEDVGNSYYCVLTREDGVVIASCPIIYDAGMAVENIEQEPEYRWYDLLGRPIQEPTQSGLYIRVQVNSNPLSPVNNDNTQKILLR